MAFEKHLGSRGSNLLGDGRRRIKRVTEETSASRASGHASREATVFDQLQATFTHTLGGQARHRVRPTSVVRARSHAVVTTDATIRIVTNETIVVIVVRTERTGRHARRFRALLTLNQQLHGSILFDLDLTDVVADRIPSRNILIEQIRIVRLGASSDTGTTVNALSGIKKMCQLFFNFFMTYPLMRLTRMQLLLARLPTTG